MMSPFLLATVVGARPQFVKAAPLSRALKQDGGLSEFIIHTGQHYDRNLSDQFFEELAIPAPEVNLEIGSLPHGAQTGRMLEQIEQVLVARKPDGVIVYGDTNSTLAGALAGAKLRIPVVHIEAGVRSFNREMPEEINRILTDHAADLLFAPSNSARDQLISEGIEQSKIVVVGDLMKDAVAHFKPMAAERSAVLKTLGLTQDPYLLATLHRAENTDRPERMELILSLLERLSSRRAVVFPVHPRTRARVSPSRWERVISAGVRVIEPVGYLDMLELESRAVLIVTDSGGVQKEAYFHQVPCATIRTETEWTELIQHGWNVLVPFTTASEMATLIEGRIGSRGDSDSLFGDGSAAAEIAMRIKRFLSSTPRAGKKTATGSIF